MSEGRKRTARSCRATLMLARRRGWPTAVRPRRKLQHLLHEIDGEEVGSVLRADEYGGDEDFSWVLLESVEGASAPSQRPGAPPL